MWWPPSVRSASFKSPHSTQHLVVLTIKEPIMMTDWAESFRHFPPTKRQLQNSEEEVYAVACCSWIPRRSSPSSLCKVTATFLHLPWLSPAVSGLWFGLISNINHLFQASSCWYLGFTCASTTQPKPALLSHHHPIPVQHPGCVLSPLVRGYTGLFWYS